jgi:hypothetical protein
MRKAVAPAHLSKLNTHVTILDSQAVSYYRYVER